MNVIDMLLRSTLFEYCTVYCRSGNATIIIFLNVLLAFSILNTLYIQISRAQRQIGMPAMTVVCSRIGILLYALGERQSP